MSRLSENVTDSEGRISSEYSPDERRTLLRIAHESILSAFADQEIPGVAPSSHLAEPRGVFTTLYLEGDLRGCVGYAAPVAPLFRAVAETARAAAFEDSRFYPVSEAEAPQLEISLSILSRLLPIRPEEVEVGRHGLVVSLSCQRGLLLPQVPVEYGWDRETFLSQTCRKAGLPADAWGKGATLEAFTAEVFGDKDV
ncbi:MAG TPA: AmmeMemoRadiSam system protein A [Terriglobales bacterium]|nr:AmmeMemoRadiSam system protein A [Terriglobales bacterium]